MKQGRLWFDSDASRNGRDQGLALVADNAGRWMDRYLAMVAELPPGWVGIGEAFQTLMGPDQPHHPNAWGAAVAVALKRRLLVKTGQYRPMSKVSSHARSSPEYRRP